MTDAAKGALLVAGIVLLATALGIHAALSHDGENDAWYEGLRNPTTGELCCNRRDCRPVKWQMRDGDHWVNDTGTWEKVPPEAVLRTTNPTGHPIMCFRPSGTIRCFIPGPQT